MEEEGNRLEKSCFEVYDHVRFTSSPICFGKREEVSRTSSVGIG